MRPPKEKLPLLGEAPKRVIELPSYNEIDEINSETKVVSLGKGPQIFYVIFLLMCLVQFSMAWIWKTPEFADLDGNRADKTFGVPFQYSIWALIISIFMVNFFQERLQYAWRVLIPLLPFWLIGCFAGTLGFSPVTSFRSLTMWMAMALAASLIGINLPKKIALRALFYGFFLICLCSIALAVLNPEKGTQDYGADIGVWRGMFLTKNQFGWVAAIGLVFALSAYRALPKYWREVMISIALVSLIMSKSAGATLSALGAFGYSVWLRNLPLTISLEKASIIFLVSVTSISVLFFTSFTSVLEMFGRDATLTGRTGIWAAYLGEIVKSPIIGRGPGAFTDVSPYTMPLALKLIDDGSIFTPHQMYIAAFGDAGILGLLSFLAVLFYFVFVVPISQRGIVTHTSAAVCMLIMLGGLMETHEVYRTGVGFFTLIFLRAVYLDKDDKKPKLKPSLSKKPKSNMKALD
jgi:exopolysaccharide production protein ExoQ